MASLDVDICGQRRKRGFDLFNNFQYDKQICQGFLVDFIIDGDLGEFSLVPKVAVLSATR